MTLVSSASAVPADTLGINCDGSLKCHEQPHDTAQLLVEYINAVDPGRYYENGQHIACRNNICAFLQGVPVRMSGAAIQNIAHFIVEHGCTVCGSVPTSEDTDGLLTFNFVSEASCGEGGVC
ncbi:killer toxin [Mycena capillaripes]|nr:killer toxin [Mycena capillaripes]